MHLHFRTPKNGIFKTQNIRLKPLKTNLIYYQKYKKRQNAYSNTKILKESAKLNFKHLTMTSLYNPISKCFVVSKHGIFITYQTNYDVIILQRFCQEIEETHVANPSGNCLLSYCSIVEVDRIRIKPSWLSKIKNYWLVPLRALAPLE